MIDVPDSARVMAIVREISTEMRKYSEHGVTRSNVVRILAHIDLLRVAHTELLASFALGQRKSMDKAGERLYRESLLGRYFPREVRQNRASQRRPKQR